MEKAEKSSKQVYRVRVLDVGYNSNYKFLDFRYFYYTIEEKNQDEAMKTAQDLYMQGVKGESAEELPILLKILSAETISPELRKAKKQTG